jgi:hypothetical protein
LLPVLRNVSSSTGRSGTVRNPARVFGGLATPASSSWRRTRISFASKCHGNETACAQEHTNRRDGQWVSGAASPGRCAASIRVEKVVAALQGARLNHSAGHPTVPCGQPHCLRRGRGGDAGMSAQCQHLLSKRVHPRTIRGVAVRLRMRCCLGPSIHGHAGGRLDKLGVTGSSPVPPTCKTRPGGVLRTGLR